MSTCTYSILPHPALFRSGYLTTQVMHAPRPRVHLMGGDGGGWALDDDLAQTRAALAGAIEEADLGTADILHSVWWVPLLSLSAAQLARKRVICHLSGDVEIGRAHV